MSFLTNLHKRDPLKLTSVDKIFFFPYPNTSNWIICHQTPPLPCIKRTFFFFGSLKRHRFFFLFCKGNTYLSQRALHLGLGNGTVGERGSCGNPNWPDEGEKSRLGESKGYGDLGEFKHPNGRGEVGIRNCDCDCDCEAIVAGGGGGSIPWWWCGCGCGGGGNWCWSCGCGGVTVFQRGENRGAKGENPENCLGFESTPGIGFWRYRM